MEQNYSENLRSNSFFNVDALLMHQVIDGDLDLLAIDTLLKNAFAGELQETEIH